MTKREYFKKDLRTKHRMASYSEDFDNNETYPLMGSELSEFAMDNKDNDIIMLRDTGFTNKLTIYPCHLKAYIILKMEDPDLALLFLEDLLATGITGEHITDDLIVRALLENCEPVLERQFMKQLDKRLIQEQKWKRIILGIKNVSMKWRSTIKRFYKMYSNFEKLYFFK